MGNSYRIRTELGVNKTINVNLEQDFEFLEILSLQLLQEDIYIRACSDYGVLVGRVTANNGLGIPNARVSVFIPIEILDESNPIISSIYPYKSPTDINEDGFRYNLLPYEKSYSTHAATGTLPTRLDVLTGNTAIEIYDKYYKFTAKTNESGDYMIMGVPLGEQTIVMDVDLSDIGEFSLTPQDLIRMGLATEAQVAGNRFRTSSDLSSLPQIVNNTKVVDIVPLWGDPTLCDIAINRLDFDLRDDANIDIQPTAVFMGSMFSTPDNFRLRPPFQVGNISYGGCKPRDNMGNLCDLQTGPGQILAIRQTIQQDVDGNPILEQYELEQNGNVIDGSGAWLVELPMNLDYYVTNEFGEKVLSNDPTIGIPTKSKYRFKIKWQQPNTPSEQTKRAYYLVPNVREFGWTSSIDPNTSTGVSQQQKDQLQSSYYFGLDWSGYTKGITNNSLKNRKLNEIIDCHDTFYQFDFNRVYTIANLIDQYKRGDGRGRFIGIKEIDDDECSTTVNKFPVNDGFRNFDLIFFIFSIIFGLIQLVGTPLILILHIVAFLWNNFAVVLLVLLIALFTNIATNSFVEAAASFPALGLVIPFTLRGLLFTFVVIKMISSFSLLKKKRFGRIKLGMITYPECQSCECTPDTIGDEPGDSPSGIFTPLSSNGLYYQGIRDQLQGDEADDLDLIASAFATAMGTRSGDKTNAFVYKSTETAQLRLPSSGKKYYAYSMDLPMGARINNFNLRSSYFDNLNKISVSFNYRQNNNQHTDNTLSVITSQTFPSGTLLTFVSPTQTQDTNFLFSAATTTLGLVQGITGTPINSGQNQITVNYATSQSVNAQTTYILNTGSTISRYKFPADLEYYQVITGLTIAEATRYWNSNTPNCLPNILYSPTNIFSNEKPWGNCQCFPTATKDVFENFQNQYILILQRGVDPYSPLYDNKYGIGKILGLNNPNDLVITASTRINFPIQAVTNNSITVQNHSQQTQIFNQSHFFVPGINFSSFTTSNVGYYSRADAQNVSYLQTTSGNRLVTKTINQAYSSTNYPSKYSLAEDLSGGDFYAMSGNEDCGGRCEPGSTDSGYFSISLLPQLTASPLNMLSKLYNVMRTDRLPSSDYLDSSSWSFQPAILQQNIGFTTYVINTDDDVVTSEPYGSGASTNTPDIEGQVGALNVLETLGDCQKMVGLTCYSGNGITFGVKQNCQSEDRIEDGCYIFVEKPLKDLQKDFKSFAEWGFRFRFFYGLCRGVLSQTFTNNWINGTLYAFPIQVNTYFDRQNKPLPPIFCKNLIYFDSDSNNFYYRSSPYLSGSTSPFIGQTPAPQSGTLNQKNLLFPTTVVNLGMKDSFYSEIILDPTVGGYVMRDLDVTSYGDTSDLVNLFVISRITDEKFIQQITSGFNPNNSLDQLFSRPEKRVDGDLAQLMSINSEIGVVKFSPEFYTSAGIPGDPVTILAPQGNLKYPTMAVWFSSTTQNLQFKDFISPGRINFRSANGTLFPFNYGIKSQVVPLYRWRPKFSSQSAQGVIFGSEINEWATSTSDIVQGRLYQGLDRLISADPTYFYSTTSPTNTDIYQRGYIFSVDSQGNYTTSGLPKNPFIVGSPNHFYFGLIKGETALDKFKTKYLPNE